MIAQSSQRLAQVRSSYVSALNQARLEAVTSITRLEQHQQKYTFQQGLLELRAPQAGVVTDLATTTVGAVVQPGTVLLSLVSDDEPLLAEVSIENRDIAFIAPNQPVRVKIAAYQFQKYGMLAGVVRTVSADSSAMGEARDDTGPQAMQFKVLVELDEQQLRVGDRVLSLTAGMQLSAEIIQGKRTVLEYLTSPVLRVSQEFGRER